MRDRSGLALLIVVGVLGILAVLTAAFVTMAQLERRASQQRLHATKARLLARSGIEDALARLSAGQEASYGGEDWDGSGGALSAFEAPQEIFQPGTANAADCPARHAMRPSFFARILPSPNPALGPVDGRQRGTSGSLSGDRSPEGNRYAIKVEDPGGIHVNGGDLGVAGEGVPGATYNTTLMRILGNLAEEIGSPLSRADGTRLVSLRPAGGWGSSEQIRQVVLGGSQAKLDLFKPYLALEAWVDKKVIRPNVNPAWTPAASGWFDVETAAAWAEIKVGQRDTPTNPWGNLANYFIWINTGMLESTQNVGNAWTGMRAFNPHTNSYAPDFERDSAGRIVGRAPVSLNWAANKPAALKALLRDLKGVWVDPEMQWNAQNIATPLLHLKRTEGGIAALYEVALAPADVSAVAAAIQAHAGFPTWTTDFPDWDQTASFDSWDEFSRFVDLKLGALAQPQRDLLKANFNPNTNLNKFNPGETVYKSLDKSDLLAYATEFSLRNPVLILTASGRILDASGRTLAERTLSLEARWQQVRFTAQSEFCAGNLGALDTAGDETAFRKPGDAGFLEGSDGTDRTYGSRFPGCPRGLCLQTYPEPQWPASPCPRPAPYDGSLQLATVDTDAATSGTSFLAPYDNGYDALPNYPPGNPACLLDERHGQPVFSLLGRGPVGTQAKLNQVYPDGCYSETYRAPGYEARDNIGDGYQGILSFWYRPSYGCQVNCQYFPRVQTPFLLNLVDVDPNAVASIYPNTQVFEIGFRKPGGSHQGAGFLLENAIDHQSPEDDFREDGPIFGWMWANAGRKTFEHAHRWMLITAQWNVLAIQSAAYGRFHVNGTDHRDLSTPFKYYTHWAAAVGANHGQPNGGTMPFATMTCLTRDCFREDGSQGTPYFFLGERGVQSMGGEGPVDGTIDDLAFVTRTTDMNDGKLFADQRYLSGRFYKEAGAWDPYGTSPSEWTSAPLALGPGARILRADWTLVLPREIGGPAGVPDMWPSPNRIFYGTGVDRVNGETADIAFMPRDPAGAALLPAPRTRNGTPLRLEPPGGTLRLGIDIRPRLDDNDPLSAWAKMVAPLLESPVLDDITLVYTGPEGPRLMAWREGE